MFKVTLKFKDDQFYIMIQNNFNQKDNNLISLYQILKLPRLI